MFYMIHIWDYGNFKIKWGWKMRIWKRIQQIKIHLYPKTTRNSWKLHNMHIIFHLIQVENALFVFLEILLIYWFSKKICVVLAFGQIFCLDFSKLIWRSGEFWGKDKVAKNFKLLECQSNFVSSISIKRHTNLNIYSAKVDRTPFQTIDNTRQ